MSRAYPTFTQSVISPTTAPSEASTAFLLYHTLPPETPARHLLLSIHNPNCLRISRRLIKVMITNKSSGANTHFQGQAIQPNSFTTISRMPIKNKARSIIPRRLSIAFTSLAYHFFDAAFKTVEDAYAQTQTDQHCSVQKGIRGQTAIAYSFLFLHR